MRLHSTSLFTTSATALLLDERGQPLHGLQLTVLAVLDPAEGSALAAEADARVKEPLLAIAEAWRANNTQLSLLAQVDQHLAACRAQIAHTQGEHATLSEQLDRALAEGADFVAVADQAEAAASRLRLLQRQETVLQQRIGQLKAAAEKDMADVLEVKRIELLAEVEAERREAFEQLEQMLTVGYSAYHELTMAAAWLESHRNPGRAMGQHFDLFQAVGVTPKVGKGPTPAVSAWERDPVHGKDFANG